jgi:glutamate-1-semialdehyde 2,1-aminomutase
MASARQSRSRGCPLFDPSDSSRRDDWPVPHERSRALFERARNLIPGGALGQGSAVDPYPLYMSKALGSRMWDVDGNEYIDFHCAFGAVLLGHNDARLRRIIDNTLNEHGLVFATAHPLESDLAEHIVRLLPSAERVIFACTGSEATYHAVRLSRAFTGRPLILKFEGNYHGWHDYTQWSVHFDPALGGPKESPTPVSGSNGMMPGADRAVVTCGYNDIATLKEQFRRRGDEIAAVIVEPILCNSGVVLPTAGFLEECRSLCDESKSLLIFDEIITGFRLGLGGAQKRVGVVPDLTTLGKAIANGMPLSAVAGRADVVDGITPVGKTFLSGTFYGHVLCVALADGCIRLLESEPPYAKLSSLGNALKTGIQAAISETGVAAQIRQFDSVWTLYFTQELISSYRDVARFARGKNHPVHVAYRRWMLTKGIYIHPHSFIRGYLNDAHTAEDIGKIVGATREFFLKCGDFLASHAQ